MRKKCCGKSYNLILFYIYIFVEGVVYEFNVLFCICIRWYIKKK